MTLTEVVNEVKDETARQYIKTGLPFEMSVKSGVAGEIDQKADFGWVESFARETGDIANLSHVDKLVIALGVQQCRVKNELSEIRKEPKQLEEFRPRRFADDYKRLDELEAPESDSDDASDSDEERKPVIEYDEDGFETVKYYQRVKAPLLIEKKKKEKEALVEEVKEEVLEPVWEELYDSDNSFDNEELGGEWITEENLHKHMTHADTQSLLAPEQNEEETEAKAEVTGEAGEATEVVEKTEVEKSEAGSKALPPVENQWTGPQHVVFLTSDFAMQNVIIQMGFTLLSLDGFRLTRVKRFKLLCRACKTINLNVERKFCEKCGNSTLAKVSVYINDKGEVTYFENPRRRINLRGTRFSIPKPKVGRDNGNLILREDEMMMGEKAQKVRAL